MNQVYSCTPGFISNLAAARTYLARWYGLQERFPRFMDHDQRRQYYDAARGFIRHYVALARQAARQCDAHVTP